MAARIEASRQAGGLTLLSALTVAEAIQGKTDPARLKWTLPRLQMEPVGQEDSLTAVSLLREAGDLPGHEYAIDALVAALASTQPSGTGLVRPAT